MLRLTSVEKAQWCEKPRLEAFAGSLIALFLAFLARASLHAFMDDEVPTLTFLIATFYVAWNYGYKWALVDLCAGFLTATYFFVKPYYSLDLPQPGDLHRMIFFFSIGLLVVYEIEKTRREQFEAEFHAEESYKRYSELVELDKSIRSQIQK